MTASSHPTTGAVQLKAQARGHWSNEGRVTPLTTSAADYAVRMVQWECGVQS